MIDWTALFDSLDEINFDNVADAVRERQRDEAEALAQTIVLSFTEVQLARKDPFEAIRMVHHRLRCSILVAKTAVELVLESDEADAASREDGGDGPDCGTPLGEAADDFQETVIGLPHPSID